MSWSACFDAQYLRIVAPFRGADAFAVRRNVHGIRVEPCPHGGVLLIATNGHALAVARDPNGSCTGSMTVLPPSALIDACKPPKVPELFDEGAVYSPSAPAWMTPGKVALSEIAGIVFHRSNKKSGVLYYGDLTDSDYALTDKEFPDWRSVIPAAPTPLSPPTTMNPALFTLLGEVSSLCKDGGGGMQIIGQGEASQYGPGPIVLRHRDFADFLACIMPMRDGSVPPMLPKWLAGVPETP